MRILIVLLGYVGAAIAGALALIVGISMLDSLELSHTSQLFRWLFMLSLTFPLPIAVPLIIFTEWKKTGSLLIFALAGVTIGVAIAVLYMDLSELLVPILLTVATTLAALTYWLITWRLLPPKAATLSPLESPE